MIFTPRERLNLFVRGTKKKQLTKEFNFPDKIREVNPVFAQ